jgi:hypothetical protein
MEQLKTCRTCGIEKPLEEFVKNKGSKGGYTHRCMPCEKVWRKQYYSNNKNKITKRNAQYRIDNGMWYNKSIDHRLRYVIQLGKIRAKKKNIKWDISLKFLKELWDKQKGLCAYSGVPLSFEDNHPHTISLDRIDSSKEYTEDNVQFVCTIVNYVKQRFDENVFFTFCKSVTQHCNV